MCTNIHPENAFSNNIERERVPGSIFLKNSNTPLTQLNLFTMVLAKQNPKRPKIYEFECSFDGPHE
jgi:hypothetical protein